MSSADRFGLTCVVRLLVNECEMIAL